MCSRFLAIAMLLKRAYLKLLLLPEYMLNIAAFQSPSHIAAAQDLINLLHATNIPKKIIEFHTQLPLTLILPTQSPLLTTIVLTPSSQPSLSACRFIQMDSCAR